MSIGQQGILAAGGVAQGKSLMGTYSSTTTALTTVNRYAPVGGSVFTNSSDALRTSLSLGLPGEISDVQNPGFVTNTEPGSVTFSQGIFSRTLGTGLYASTAGGVTTPTYSTGSLVLGAADEINFNQVTSSGTAAMRGILATFRHTGTGYVQVYGFGTVIPSGSSTTRGTSIVGPTQSTTVNAPWLDVRLSVATRLLSAKFRFFSNTRTTDTDIQLTVNGVAVASGTQAAGSISDLTLTANYDASPGDTVRITFVMGAGSGNLNLNGIVVANNLSTLQSDVFCPQRTSCWNAASVQYCPLVANAASNTAQSGVLAYNQHTIGFRATLDTPQVYVSTNGGTAPSIARLLVNGAASGVSVTIPVGVINQWITGTGSVEVGPTDLVAWECTSAIVSGGTGNANPTMLGIRCTYLSDS